MLAVILCLLAVILPFAIRLFKKLNNINNAVKHIPSPPGKPLVGHALDFKNTGDILPVMHKHVQKYGGVFYLTFGFCFPFLGIADIKLVEYILTSPKILNKSDDYKFFKNWLGNGLLTSPASTWTKTRKMITPSFHFQILEQFLDVFHSCTEILIKNFENTNRKPFDVFPFLTAYTMDVICETSMGITINSQENSDGRYVQTIKEITRIAGERGLSLLKQNDYLYYFSKDFWKERRLVKYVHDYTDRVIQSRREQLEGKKINVEQMTDDFGRKKKMAFLDLLLQSTIDGKPLTNDEIKQEVNTIMFAGHDTTSTAMAFTLYCISMHKNIQNKLIEELQDIFHDDKFRTITHADLNKLKYLEKVIKESMRLFPPVAAIGRELDENLEYYGGVLPAGLPLTILIYSIHRDPKVYPDPEKFDPERFSPEEQAKRSAFSYIPFSAGSRNCIGQRFGMLEMKFTLANILRKFEILPVEEHKMQLALEVIYKSKNGVYIKVAPRNF